VIAPIEVERGLVMRFDPERLLKSGAAPDRPPERAVVGPHYFICIGRCGQWSVWTPAFSRYRPGRSKVGYKAGVRDWASQDAFVDLEQMWIVPDDALAWGSAGVDHTARGSRNRASWSFLLGPVQLGEVG